MIVDFCGAHAHRRRIGSDLFEDGFDAHVAFDRLFQLCFLQADQVEVVRELGFVLIAQADLGDARFQRSRRDDIGRVDASSLSGLNSPFEGNSRCGMFRRVFL
jgi:hypothetical protein